MEEYFEGDPLQRKHYLMPAPQLRNGLVVDFQVTVSRLEADGSYTQLHYFIAVLGEHWPSRALALFYARETLKNYYATQPILV